MSERPKGATHAKGTAYYKMDRNGFWYLWTGAMWQVSTMNLAFFSTLEELK